MKLDPIPENPTPEDQMRAIHQVHECLEASRVEIADHRADDRQDHSNVSKRVGSVEKRVRQLERRMIEEIKPVQQAVGVIDEEGKPIKRRTVGQMTQLDLVTKAGGLFAALFVLLQIGRAVEPGLWSAIQALWKLAMR